MIDRSTGSTGGAVHVVERDVHQHRSFRLTRTAPTTAMQVAPALVLPDREARLLLAAATQADVARGGSFSAGPAGIQVWSGPWDGVLGTRGSAAHHGSVDWSYDTPAKHYVTVYRVLVTARGLAAGCTPDGVLSAVLALAGLSCPPSASGARPSALPPDPFRSVELRAR